MSETRIPPPILEYKEKQVHGTLNTLPLPVKFVTAPPKQTYMNIPSFNIKDTPSRSQQYTETTEKTLKSSYYIEFSDGYSFRSLLEYLKLTILKGSIVVMKNGIYHSSCSNSGDALYEFEIFACELPSFIYDSELEEIVEGIDFSAITPVTKNMKKKCWVKLFREVENRNIFIKIFSTGTSIQNIHPVLVYNFRYTNYSVSELFENKNPICTVPLDDFCGTMDTQHKNNGKLSNISIFDKGIVIVDEQRVNNSPVGQFGVTSGDDLIYMMSVDTKHLKDFSKMKNIGERSCVKIYYSEDETYAYLMFEFKIGHYGNLRTTLRQKIAKNHADI